MPDRNDAIEVLVRDHRRMEALLSELVSDGAANDPARTKALFKEMADALVAHFTVEEQHFYPAVKAKRTEDTLLESLEEHLSLKRVLADLVELDDPAHPTFGPKMHVLKEQVEHHHKEEEEHLFPDVRKLLDEAARQELGARIGREMKALERSQPREDVLEQTAAAAPLR
jgi:hemerythrin superfamily protein